MICLSPGTKSEHSAYSQAMVRITCSVDLRQEVGHGVRRRIAKRHVFATRRVSPVPHFDRVSGGGEDGQVVRAEGQRAGVGAVAAQREASGLVGCRGLVSRLQAVGFYGVVLQQQRHLEFTACT